MEFDSKLWETALPDVEVTEENSCQALRNAYEVLFDNSIPMPKEDSIRAGAISIISAGLVFSLPASTIESINANIHLFGDMFVWPLIIYSFKKGYKKAVEDRAEG